LGLERAAGAGLGLEGDVSLKEKVKLVKSFKKLRAHFPQLRVPKKNRKTNNNL
jgi:hypothetical protein